MDVFGFVGVCSMPVVVVVVGVVVGVNTVEVTHGSE